MYSANFDVGVCVDVADDVFIFRSGNGVRACGCAVGKNECGSGRWDVKGDFHFGGRVAPLTGGGS